MNGVIYIQVSTQGNKSVAHSGIPRFVRIPGTGPHKTTGDRDVNGTPIRF